MIIKSLKLAPFAGLNETEVNFSSGLNVLYGPNEAGKSTVVEGLYAALFQQIKLKRSVRADQEFHQRARRYPDGDHAHLQVTFDEGEKTYHLTKHWQQGNSYIQLTDGQVKIAEEEAVRQKMDAFLRYGPQTYANVLFARQSTLQKTLEELEQDADTSATVDQILKKAVMQLDGVSVEALRRKLDHDIEQLGKRWDLGENRPENNRTIQNPYKTGIGEVLKAYYNEASFRMDLQAVIKGEKAMEAMNDEIRGMNQTLEETTRQLTAYELIEPQVIERENIELKQVQLKKEYQGIFEINKEWPVKEADMAKLRQQVPALQEKVSQLKVEREQLHQWQLLEQDRELLVKADELRDQIEKASKDAEKYAFVNEADVKELEEQEGNLRHAEASMEAATLVASLEMASAQVRVTAGFHQPVTLKAGQGITANGSLRFEMGEGGETLSFQVNAGEIDFEKVKANYEVAFARKATLLKNLTASSLEEARQLLGMKKEKEQVRQQLLKTYTSVVGDKNLDVIRKKRENTKSLSVRAMKEVSAELDNTEKKWQEKQRQLLLVENQLAQWVKEYKDHDHLVDTLMETKAAIKKHETAMEKLATLPLGFNTSADFRNHVAQLRKKKSELSEELYRKKEALTDFQHNLPDDSSEELTRALEEAENEFFRKKNQLNRLVIIRQTLEKVIGRLDQHSGKPLVEAFQQYLGFITENRYQSVSLDESFQIKIQRLQNNNMIPSLFSAGTYDSVALAFRFALIDQLFTKKGAVIVLDDCLVNLDPQRKTRTIQLIQEKAEQHQIIFTTCQPETAEQLGGHMIQLG